MYIDIIIDYKSGLNLKDLDNKYQCGIRKVKHILLDNNIRLRTPAESYNLKKSHETFTSLQEQMILGSLLGDACLYHQYYKSRQTNKPCNTYRLAFAHSEKQLQYLKIKRNILNVNNKIQTRLSGHGSTIKYFTLTSQKLAYIANLVLRNDKKYITQQWLDKLDAQSLAFWYMDDGSYTCGHSKSVHLATHSFNAQELKLLQDKLSSFNITTTLNKHRTNQYSTRIAKDSCKQFFGLINPWICPDLTYKLGDYVQQFSGTLGTKICDYLD